MCEVWKNKATVFVLDNYRDYEKQLFYSYIYFKISFWIQYNREKSLTKNLVVELYLHDEQVV